MSSDFFQGLLDVLGRGVQADVGVLAQQSSNLQTLSLWQQAGAQIRGSDGVGFLQHQLPASVEAGGRHSEGERQNEREQPQHGRHH
jgi:hypothetical protein